MSIEKTKITLSDQLVKSCLFLIIVFPQLIGTANAQSWATEEYVQKKRIEIERRIRDYGQMLVRGDDRDWKHLKENYLKQLPSITSADEYKNVMDGLAKQEWRSLRLNSIKADCDGIPKVRCETFVYELLAEVISPYVNERKTWQEMQESHLVKLKEQEDEKNRIAALMKEVRTVAEIETDREKAASEKLAEMLAKEEAERAEGEAKLTAASPAKPARTTSTLPLSSCPNLYNKAIRALDDVNRLAKYRDLFSSPGAALGGREKIDAIYPEYGELRKIVTQRLSQGATSSYAEGVELQKCTDYLRSWESAVAEKVMRTFH